MNYQTLVCFGDSLAFGARTYDCYPMIAGKLLTEQTRYSWRTLNISRNGRTARSLWFAVNDGTLRFDDAYIACVLIGSNDTSAGSPPDVFGEYYRQIVRTLVLQKFRVVLCATIPPLHCDGHAFFTREGEERRPALNAEIRKVVDEFDACRLLDLEGVTEEHCVDPAHFNSAGNAYVAEQIVAEVTAL